MPNFFKSFFSGKSETPESEKQKNDQKNFEIFKYDGLRAQRMGRPDYTFKWEKQPKPANCWKKWLPWNLISRVLS